MSTQQKLQNFDSLLSTLNDISSDKRVDFLVQCDVDTVADLLIEDNPPHFTLLKRIMELLTLVPIEERYIVEEIATAANYKHTEHSYNQFRLFSSSDSDDLEQNIDDESDFPSFA